MADIIVRSVALGRITEAAPAGEPTRPGPTCSLTGRMPAQLGLTGTHHDGPVPSPTFRSVGIRRGAGASLPLCVHDGCAGGVFAQESEGEWVWVLGGAGHCRSCTRRADGDGYVTVTADLTDTTAGHGRSRTFDFPGRSAASMKSLLEARGQGTEDRSRGHR